MQVMHQSNLQTARSLLMDHSCQQIVFPKITSLSQSQWHIMWLASHVSNSCTQATPLQLQGFMLACRTERQTWMRSSFSIRQFQALPTKSHLPLNMNQRRSLFAMGVLIECKIKAPAPAWMEMSCWYAIDLAPCYNNGHHHSCITMRSRLLLG